MKSLRGLELAFGKARKALRQGGRKDMNNTVIIVDEDSNIRNPRVANRLPRKPGKRFPDLKKPWDDNKLKDV